MIGKLLSRMPSYWGEVAHAFELGSSWADGCKLSVATLRFHASNLLHPGGTVRQTPPRRYQIRIHGRPFTIWMRPHGGDLFIFHEIFRSECYRPPRQAGQDVRTVLDLGANIGLTTLYFHRYFPDAHYYCVEPNPANAALLRRNVEGLGGRAQVLESAVSNYCGSCTFNGAAASYGGTIVSGGDGLRVRCDTMESILDHFSLPAVDILKVDIEGAEALLFQNSVSWLRRVRALVIELHNGYDFAQFQKDIEAADMRIVPADPKHPMVWASRL